jgi:hypothetical protein
MCDFAIGFTLPHKMFDNIIIAKNTNTNKYHIAVNYNENGEKCKTLCGQILNTPFDGWKPNWSKCEPVKSIDEFDNMVLFWNKCERCEKAIENIRKNLTNKHINGLFYDNKKEENVMCRGDAEIRMRTRQNRKDVLNDEDMMADGSNTIQFLVVLDDTPFWCENQEAVKEVIKEYYETYDIDTEKPLLKPVVYKLEEIEYQVDYSFFVNKIHLEQG